MAIATIHVVGGDSGMRLDSSANAPHHHVTQVFDAASSGTSPGRRR